MKRKEEDPIEKVLNQINASPDLGESILDFVYPYMSKAYNLLKSDNFKNTHEEKVFKNLEEKIALESILLKDLPGIVDIYVKLPLKYRNTHQLKNGKTHRETLLDNIELLINKMVAIENAQYSASLEEWDKTVIVKENLILNKYKPEKKEDGLELEPELSIDRNTFNWNHFKKTLPEESLDKSPVNYETGTDNNKMITLKDGEIAYKVKSKMKYFMQGVYQAVMFPPRMVMKGAKLIENNFGTFLLLGVMSSLIGFIGYNYYLSKYETVIKHMKYVEKYLNAPSANLLTINMKVLNQYVKENSDIDIKLGNDQKLLYVTMKTTKRECMVAMETINDPRNNHNNKNFNYLINTTNLNGTVESSKEITEAVCDLPENIVKINYVIKK